MNKVWQEIEKLKDWIAGTPKVPVKIKEENKRGNGEKPQADKIRGFWK